MKYHVHTTGCKANQWDSRVIESTLKKAGLEQSSIADAEVVIVNACTVTEGAERDVRRFLNRLRRSNPSARIILAGCHSQAFPEKTFGADLVVGQKEKFNLPSLLDRSGSFVSDDDSFPIEPVFVDDLTQGRTRFFFKIQDGCDRGCSYCIVPRARGNPRSRPTEDILETLAGLEKKGINEVVLTGIEISAYRDEKWGVDLTGLLALLEYRITPPRIRLSSVDPRYADVPFVDIFRMSGKLAPSIHIPLQSGCDSVLSRMGRRYDTRLIKDLVAMFRNGIEDMGIGMDVIAGFPGESDGDFVETYRFLEALDIYYLHVFPFSRREGTAAWSMNGQVPDEIKKERVRLLRELDARKRRKFYARSVGKIFSVVLEGKLFGKKYMKGFTDNYIPVYVPWSGEHVGKMVQVRLIRVDGDVAVGTIIAPSAVSFAQKKKNSQEATVLS